MTLNWNFQRNGVFKPKQLPWGAQIFSGTAVTQFQKKKSELSYLHVLVSAVVSLAKRNERRHK